MEIRLVPAGAISSIFQIYVDNLQTDVTICFCSKFQICGLFTFLFCFFFWNYVCLQKKKLLQEEAVSLLRSDNTVFDKALVLCQMHNFKEGILYLYEKGKL